MATFNFLQNFASAFVYCSGFLIGYKLTEKEINEPGSTVKSVKSGVVSLFKFITAVPKRVVNCVRPKSNNNPPGLWKFWRYDYQFYRNDTKNPAKPSFTNKLQFDIDQYIRDISKSKRVCEADDLAYENLINTLYFRSYRIFFDVTTWLRRFPLVQHYFVESEIEYFKRCYEKAHLGSMISARQIKEYDGKSFSIKLFEDVFSEMLREGLVCDEFMNPHHGVKEFEPFGIT